MNSSRRWMMFFLATKISIVNSCTPENIIVNSMKKVIKKNLRHSEIRNKRYITLIDQPGLGPRVITKIALHTTHPPPTTTTTTNFSI